MTEKQKKAVIRLEKALENCHKCGLIGGVYDGSFYAWPEDAPHPADAPSRQFFDKAKEIGQRCYTLMTLDGGAGA